MILVRVLVACIVSAVPMATLSASATADESTQIFPVSFDSEWVRLEVVGDSIEVHGTYYLRCNARSSAMPSLFYPFPVDSLLGAARMVSLRGRLDGTDLGSIGWTKRRIGPPGVRWDTPACLGDTIAIDAVYRQKLMTTYARYIVTSTRAWEQPLRHARFDIRLPAGAIPVDFSFPFVACTDSNGPYYRYETANFFPDRDIIVRWEAASTK